MQKQVEVFTINTNNEQTYVNDINTLLKEGWQIHSSNIGFCNSESYNFCNSFMAVMVRMEEVFENSLMEVKVYPNLSNSFEVLAFRDRLEALEHFTKNPHSYSLEFMGVINSLQTLIEEQL